MKYFTNDIKSGAVIVIIASAIVLAGITMIYQTQIKKINENYISAMNSAQLLNETIEKELKIIKEGQKKNNLIDEREEKITEEYSTIQQKADFLEEQNKELAGEKEELLKNEEKLKKEIDALRIEKDNLEKESRNAKNLLFKIQKDIDLCEELSKKLREERDNCIQIKKTK